jgi:predicted small lipoprotein YifL
MNPQPRRAQPKASTSRVSAGYGRILVVSLALLLVGCGNRGSLYLPEGNEPATSTPVSSSEPGTAVGTTGSQQADTDDMVGERFDEESDDEDDNAPRNR